MNYFSRVLGETAAPAVKISDYTWFKYNGDRAVGIKFDGEKELLRNGERFGAVEIESGKYKDQFRVVFERMGLKRVAYISLEGGDKILDRSRKVKDPARLAVEEVETKPTRTPKVTPPAKPRVAAPTKPSTERQFGLTPGEQAVIVSIFSNDYNSGDGTDSIWSAAINDSQFPSGIESRALPGVVSSLSKKGLLSSSGGGKDAVVQLTTKGAKIARSLYEDRKAAEGSKPTPPTKTPVTRRVTESPKTVAKGDVLPRAAVNSIIDWLRNRENAPHLFNYFLRNIESVPAEFRTFRGTGYTVLKLTEDQSIALDEGSFKLPLLNSWTTDETLARRTFKGVVASGAGDDFVLAKANLKQSDVVLNVGELINSKLWSDSLKRYQTDPELPMILPNAELQSSGRMEVIAQVTAITPGNVVARGGEAPPAPVPRATTPVAPVPPPPAKPPTTPVPATQVGNIGADYERARKGPDSAKVSYMQHLWRYYNAEKFKGEMKMPSIFRFLKETKRFSKRAHWRGGSYREIAVRRELFNAPKEKFHEIFLHEMCHQAVSEITKLTYREPMQGHGPVWQDWMRRVGLNPARYDSDGVDTYMDEEEKKEFEAKKQQTELSLKGALRISPMEGKPARYIKDGNWIEGVIVCRHDLAGKRWAFKAATYRHEPAAGGSWFTIPQDWFYALPYEGGVLEQFKTAEWKSQIERIQRDYEMRRARRGGKKNTDFLNNFFNKWDD